MNDYRTIQYEISRKNDSVCYITLNRPDKHNAINREMAVDLSNAFHEVRGNAGIGVVVLGGAGEKAFCTGGDLSVFPSLADHQSAMNWLAHSGLDVQEAIMGCEKVVIGKIDGHCLAGGLELALCCDLLYAKESARFGATEINMGVLPGWGGTARLPRSLPIFRAREIIYSGRKDYTAREMYDMGCLTRVYPDEVFEERFNEVVTNISAKKPIALRMAKEVMTRSEEGGSIGSALALERNAIQWLQNAPDVQAVLASFKENPNGFTEKQKASNVATDAEK
jgi:enoyl-CoA hydratase/carnithine racemase